MALKSLKDPNDVATLREEAQLLIKLRHPHIVSFYGLQKDSQGIEYMVLEYLSKGSLLSLLREEKANISMQHLFSMATDTAKGMEYLEAANIIHRDLSCRNCLVTELRGSYCVKVTVKI